MNLKECIINLWKVQWKANIQYWVLETLNHLKSLCNYNNGAGKKKEIDSDAKILTFIRIRKNTFTDPDLYFCFAAVYSFSAVNVFILESWNLIGRVAMKKTAIALHVVKWQNLFLK